jgi:hypothetical protein
MGRQIAFYCDNPYCGAQKKSENHWWKVVEGEGHVSVWPFDPAEPLGPGESIACGESCRDKLVSAACAALRGGRHEAKA